MTDATTASSDQYDDASRLAAAEHDPVPTAFVAPAWASPPQGLVLALLAAAVQLVVTYARGPLDERMGSGARLDRFDELLIDAAMLDAPAAVVIPAAIGVVVLVLVGASVRVGVRAPIVHGATVVVALVAILAPLAVGAAS